MRWICDSDLCNTEAALDACGSSDNSAEALSSSSNGGDGSGDGDGEGGDGGRSIIHKIADLMRSKFDGNK